MATSFRTGRSITLCSLENKLSAAKTSVHLAAVCSNQSASANTLHQPFGLISPSTTLQALGGSKNVQVAHMRMSFGVSRYSASFCDIFSRARVHDNAPDAIQAATLANAARSTLRRKTRLSVMGFFFGIKLPALPLFNTRFRRIAGQEPAYLLVVFLFPSANPLREAVNGDQEESQTQD